MSDVKCELIHDHFQNARSYNIPRAQLMIADIPYNIGGQFYASRPDWYVDGDNSKGESDKAHKAAFHTDYAFNIADFFAFGNRLLKPEPSKGEKDAPCMIVFCSFQQIPEVITEAEKYGFKHYIPLVFRKPFSAQVLKANMKIVGNCEYGLVLYKNRLPKFNNNGRMIFNCFDWPVNDATPKVHPTQKPVPLLQHLISIFTDPDDVVIDPCAGSASTLLAAGNLNRRAYGFEIKKDFYKEATTKILPLITPQMRFEEEKRPRYVQTSIV